MTAPRTNTKSIKRYRDPLSPKSILDRPSLTKSLKSNGIVLKHGQLDLFYQLYHRAGYPPLDEFVKELTGSGGNNDNEISTPLKDDDDGYDDGSVSININSNSNTSTSNFRTKNAISSRASKRAQLPKSFLNYLTTNLSNYTTLTSTIHQSQTSSNGTTTKLAIRLQDGHIVESVLMRHAGRVTICVSSQVGCAMGCTFCATGTMGIRGNLCSGEILEQLVHGSRILLLADDEEEEQNNDKDEGDTIKQKGSKKKKRMDLIRNVVFMGMGEPLNNYQNVLSACKSMIDRRTWNLAHNRVTVSTVGVPSRMRDLTHDLPEVNLALSLHAPNQRLRESIVPSAKGTPIEVLIEALDEHMMALVKRKLLVNSSGGNPQGDEEVSGSSGDGVVAEFNAEERQSASKKKRAMIEYVMLEGDTSTIEAAHQLGKLCENRHLVVNLIPYNKTDVKDKLSCPSEEHMQKFRAIVSSYGSFCSIRRTMGADIAGACGQLVVEQERKKGQQSDVLDIEDGPFHSKGLEERRVVTTVRSSKRMTMQNETEPLEQKSTEEKQEAVDPWVRRLTIATAVAASCFVVSGALLVLQKRKR